MQLQAFDVQVQVGLARLGADRLQGLGLVGQGLLGRQALSGKLGGGQHLVVVIEQNGVIHHRREA